MNTAQKPALFESLRQLQNDISMTKAASQKQAESPTPDDPGGYAGATTHPTKSVDNRGQSASEGSRSSENTADVNAAQGAPGVNKASDNTGRQDDAQLNIGTEAAATGEAPGVEDDYKAGKDDPGTTHPAATDNDSLDGHKYANASMPQCYDLFTKLANALLADLANGQPLSPEKQAASTLNPAAAGESPPAAPKQQVQGSAPAEKAAEEEEAAADDSSLSSMIEKAAAAVTAGNAASASTPAANNADLQAGYELAETLGLQKKAAQQMVADSIARTIQDAQYDAYLLGNYLTAYQKTAMEGASPEDGENHDGSGDDTSGANDAEGASGETSEGSGGGPAEGGGDAAGGPDVGPGLGDALGGGADPGGMMGGGPPEGPGGGANVEQLLMELVSALQELGISPEELAGGGGGAPAGPDGGMPPGAGMPPAEGMPPGAGGGGDPAAMMSEGMKLASAAKSFQRSGKYRFKEAADGTPRRALRDNMKSFILELMK